MEDKVKMDALENEIGKVNKAFDEAKLKLM